MGTVRDLRDFLLEAELEHYYSAFKNELKIASVPQIKYLEEEDLVNIGMTKPEMRRLKKFYKKECPQGKLEKFKRAIMTKSVIDSSPRTLSPSPPGNRVSRPISYIRPMGKQIISSDSIQMMEALGEGEFGKVMQGTWTTESGEKVQVAIKCLSRERLENGTQEFLKEAGLMQSIDHDNIVRMYGVVLDKDNSLMLVTELAPMRSLLECLKEPSLRVEFPLPRLCDFAQQICDGMSYLESKRLIHRDLAARNILVFNKSMVKVSDFGLSRALGVGKDYYQSNFSINLKLPIAWCAPECINYLKFTSASDVWAYGTTLWELFTYGFQPWAGMTGQQILDAIDQPNCQRLERPDLCPLEYYNIMLNCWEHEPECRPTFSELFIKLPQMRPTQVKATKDFPEITVPKDYLYYRAYDVIVVIDKRPVNPPVAGLWKGVSMNGKVGYFDPHNAVPFVEPITSPVTPANKMKPVSRKDSKRGSGKKIRSDMISRPQNDLRHTGHIGYDGAIFGDVGFIGDNYDKLPVKVSSGKLNESRNSINISRHSNSPDKDLSNSDISLNGGPGHTTTNGFGRSWISVESLESQSALRSDDHDHADSPNYNEIDDDESLLADFKMPDLSSSFDFGPSFMDEVLKALNEKESLLESQNDKMTSSPKEEEKQPLLREDRNQSAESGSPPKEIKSPPPLPNQPPRLEPKPGYRMEPKKQAKVKPMSASDEKLIDNAITMANKMELQRLDSANSPESESAESGSESPRLISKLKASLRRSPKQERQRTFSDSVHQELSDDIPPEAQEAYNMLVVHGSVKDTSRSKHLDNSFGSRENRQLDTSFGSRETKQLDSSFGSRGNKQFDSSFGSHENRQLDTSFGSRESGGSFKDESRNKHLDVSFGSPECTSSVKDKPKSRQTDSGFETRESHRGSTGSGGLDFAFADSSSSSSPSKTPDRESPARVLARSSSERVSVSPSNMGRSNNAAITITPDRQFESKPAPVPKPRPEVPPKRSEIPVPKPRPEIVQRVEPTPRPPPPAIPAKETSRLIQEDKDSKQAFVNPLVINEDEWNNSGQKSRQTDNVKNEKSSRINKFGEVIEAPEDEKPAPASFEDEVSEPSPREIMNKLRESRLKRSIDHQRGVMGEDQPAPNRNLREPQGIPGKSFSASNNGVEEEEVDTNPLRMLRGGVIPVRGGRAGSGTNSSKPTLRHPKLHFNNPGLQHSVSVDTGSDRLTYEADGEGEQLDGADSPPPKLPPRSISVCDSPVNPLPLPPRNPLRPSSLNQKPRERKYPLLLESPNGDSDSPNSQISQTSQHSLTGDQLNDCKASSDYEKDKASSECDSSVKHFPDPDDTACKALHDTDSSSYADLPVAPPPPIRKDEINEIELDDNVFEISDSPRVSKQLNLSSEGGTSGAATFPRGFKLFGLKNVSCNLEQLGFYNHQDPFWVKTVTFNDENRCYSDRSTSTDAEASPLMLANYKTCEGVSYEDLLDFAIDREKNGEEIEAMQKVFSYEVSREDCIEALKDTKWDFLKAIKYIKLKQLLSTQLGDVSRCKDALLACDWSVQDAADYLLGHPPPSPECVDV